MSKKLTFQEIILTLQQYWNDQGCMLMQAYDNEKGAGTMSPYTFLRAIGPEPWNAAYVEPSRRPADGRYGDNPNRLFQHHQFQVIVTLFTILSGLQVLNTEKSSFNQNMSTQNTALKSQTKICFLKTLKNLKKKQDVLWNWVLFTQPTTTY